MRECVLFIAMSLDGYIADDRGEVSWLHGQGGDEENIDVYAEFIKEVDTVFMGHNTYHQITTELSPDKWVYSDLMTYVFTHNKIPSAENIRCTDEDPAKLLKKLKSENGKSIWICGGAKLIGQLINEDLIDRYYISVIPAILGGGIRLFGNIKDEINLKLIKTQSYNGITDLIYTRR